MFSNLSPDFIFSKDEISKDFSELLPIWSNEWSSRWLFNANRILRRYMAGYSYVQSILPFAIQSGNVCRFVILYVEFLQD